MATDNEESLENIRNRINEKFSAESRHPTPRSDVILCELCSDTGYIHVSAGVVRCECQKQKVINRKLAAIPARFRTATFANYDPINRKQDRAKDFMSGDFTRSYFVCGPYGMGKTHLATAQYVQLVRIERSCMFFTMAELYAELRRAEMDSEYFCQVRDKCRHADKFHLFLDDMDKFKPTDFKDDALFDLIDTVYKRNVGLTITSNYTLSEMATFQTVHPGILRRIDDICEVIEL